MNKPLSTLSVRDVLERVFAGIACAAIVAFVAVGTVAMCVPGAGAA